MYFGRLRRFVDAREPFIAKKTKNLNFLHLKKILSKAPGREIYSKSQHYQRLVKKLIRLID